MHFLSLLSCYLDFFVLYFLLELGTIFSEEYHVDDRLSLKLRCFLLMNVWYITSICFIYSMKICKKKKKKKNYSSCHSIR